ncbi:MAG: sigma-70 family RNA polymerase sigma factor [Candidatus Brocadiia bacterium]|nr:MAG: sigma-70 family RNA polymerase sigma factor [Candidatus Brocadiia bacterium]
MDNNFVREIGELESLCEQEVVSLQQGQGGSEEAFEAVVRRYMKDAYFIALGFVGNRDDALDMSQEAFVRAYRNISRLRKGSNFFPWFYQILKNLCFSHLRKKRRPLQSTDFEDEDGNQFQMADEGQWFDPEAVTERNESKDRVWKALGLLDEKHREVIILRHFRDLSYEEISKLLLCNKGTITSRLYYARKRLKELLEESSKGGRQ